MGEITKYPLRKRGRASAGGGTYDYVKIGPVPRGQVWKVSSHSFENETGARGTVRAYIDRGGYEHWLWEQASPAAATLYWSEEDMTLNEGEWLACRQASCTQYDALKLLLNGYVIFGSEGQVV